MDEQGAPRVLLVEDDTAVREGVVSALSAHGYEVSALADGTDFDRVLQEFRPDIVILDVGLPGPVDGFGLARRLRSMGEISFLFLTALDAVEDRVQGFELGGDDYIVKPFSIAELVVRIRAILRRTGRLASAALHVQDTVVDVSSRVVKRGDQVIALTPTEFDLLATLARTPGQKWSKRELLREVWGFEDYRPHLVEVHVSSLRRKLEAHGARLVHTERGAGYSVRR